MNTSPEMSTRIFMITAAVLQHKSVVSNLDNLLKQGWEVQNFIYLFILSI